MVVNHDSRENILTVTSLQLLRGYPKLDLTYRILLDMNLHFITDL